MCFHTNVLRQAKIILSQRHGKGPWVLWIPLKTKRYRSGPIKTRSEMQALGAWLASETDGKTWHNSIFKDYKEVVYHGRKYNKEEGKILYKEVVKNGDWEAVDLGESKKIEEIELPF
jgi:hypothetical protein